MWLLRIDVLPLRLTEFIGDPTSPYAILSHTWDKEEILFADIGRDGIERKAGYSKVLGTIQQAAQDSYQYVWVDTCCIDRSSSAELSEAINSMFFYYQQATICYAYLSDVESLSQLSQSRWFTRGWTLQELLAPRQVNFYTSHWQLVGTKSGLAHRLSQITRISEPVLAGTKAVTSASVAQRMSWASTRHTTRIEDSAYCLLGIFGVNMPLLYGERGKAFMRLQEAIIQVTNDQTLFAWMDPDADPEEERGLLATSPRFFAHSAAFEPFEHPEHTEPYSINKGRIKADFQFFMRPSRDYKSLTYTAILACCTTDWSMTHPGIVLRPISVARREFSRIQCSKVYIADFGTYEINSIFVPIYPRQRRSACWDLNEQFRCILLRRCTVRGGLRILSKGHACEHPFYPSQTDNPCLKEQWQLAQTWLPQGAQSRFLYRLCKPRLVLTLHFGVSIQSDPGTGCDISVLFCINASGYLVYTVVPDQKHMAFETINKQFIEDRATRLTMEWDRLLSNSRIGACFYSSGANPFGIKVVCFESVKDVFTNMDAFCVDIEFGLQARSTGFGQVVSGDVLERRIDSAHPAVSYHQSMELV